MLFCDVKARDISEAETQSDRSRFKGAYRPHAWLQDYETSYACITEQGEPSSYQEACQSMHSSHWIVAMEGQMESLHKKKTWELVELPME